MKASYYLLLLLLACSVVCQAQKKEPVKIGVIGLTHSHVHWIFNREKRGEIKIVGIVETNKELAERYAQQYHFSISKVYSTIEEMVDREKPIAVAAFGSIAEHLQVVEVCAPLGIHVMVEKPLAINLQHAKKMEALAKKYDIHLLVNYETTWYPTVHQAYQWLKSDSIGKFVQAVIRDGHKGPKKIGIDKEFLEWLIDPDKNGGGAITDFGCYGINLSTWIHQGKRPLTVTAVTQQLQPQNNPKVDDESTILLTYDSSKVTIQASWNWPIGRKDMEVYGTKGVIYADNKRDIRLRIGEGYDGFKETATKLDERTSPYDDPFAFLAAIIQQKIKLQPFDLSSLENNMIVMEILEAAKESAKTGKTIKMIR
jgi:predicted dehydrogenase